MVQPSGILPFYLLGDNGGKTPVVRGRLARLFTPTASLFDRHGYPDVVSGLCAETVALAACLSATLKFDGIFTIQAKGDGAVRTLFADVTSDGAIRSYAAFDDDAVSGLPVSHPAQLSQLMGGGYMAFTIDQDASVSGDKAHRYQGIVELSDGAVSDCAEQWFSQSEQLASSVMTTARRTEGGWAASALFLQQIAPEGGVGATDSIYADDAFHTASTLASSVTQDELLSESLSAEDILFRLFHSQAVHVQHFSELRDQCRCSDEKVEVMLAGLSAQQRRELSDEAGQLLVGCEFCKSSRTYHLSSFQD